MNKTISLAAFAIVLLASGCMEQEFKKAKDGSEYKIFHSGDTAIAHPGNFIELDMVVRYKDSTIFSSIESSTPRFIPFDTASFPPFFREVHEGDSLILRQSTDSILKHGPGAPWMQKGQYIYQSFKVVKLFPNKEAVDSVSKTLAPLAKAKAYKKATDFIEKLLKDSAALAAKDDKAINDYLTKNNIKATKTPWGTYVSITNPGTGPMITENDVAVVNYTGKTFNDSTFDSNTDKKFNHVEPYDVDMSEYSVIPGWIDGLKLMQKGSKGKIIIPSLLAYGKNGKYPKIGPDENLVFDIEVTDIITQDQYQKDMEAQQKASQMQQQQMMQERMQHMQEMQKNAADSSKKTKKK